MPAAPRSTIYANVVNFRLTPAEFVLEFGAHFPDQPGQPPASDFQPDVRVVLPASALQGVIHAINQIQRQPTPQRKPSVGFQSPPTNDRK